MTKNEIIILPIFDSIEDGSSYLTTNALEFAFAVNDKIYSSTMVEIIAPINSELIPINGIFIQLFEDPQPGQLHIEDGFLKYFKEDHSAIEEELI